MENPMFTDSYKNKVHIRGGGTIGLSIGWQLVRANVPTVIFDAKKPKASSVAAGMLAPYAEALLEDSPLFKTCQKSLSLFPQFLKELQEDSCNSVSLKSSGSLLVGIDADDARWLERLCTCSKAREVEIHKLTGEQAREKEPLLSPKVNHALWIPRDANIDQKLLFQSLKKAFLARGGKIVEHQVEQLPIDEVVVIAAGAWSEKFGLPIRPLKGQIVTMKTSSPLNHMIRSPRVYLTPTSTQIIRVGATSEEAGFNLSVTGWGARSLLRDGWEIMPELDQMFLLSIDTGLRPVTSDRSLLIGKANQSGLFYATGHGRNGILLAPYTAYKLKKEICKYYSMVKAKK